ncbi:MAG: hypothetical protein KGN74_15290 [Gemmatimonadota bacterium]|nr:hypothetical protein [Gemmatimonadota bacterium]MDE3216685.1 hypothetical protein [Gemmatimonadota bacterium]
MTTLASAPATAVALPDAWTPAEREADFWVRWFMIIQVLSQLAIIGPLGSMRTLMRIAAFGSSLVFLFLVRGKAGAHPARTAAVVVMVILGVSIFNPTAAVLPAALAQVGLYLAVLAPLFWVPRLTVGVQTLWTLLTILWAFHSVGSIVGVLQVYFPGQFQPKLSPVILGLGRGYVESLMITTSSGVRVFRPMGLTDVPGGAGTSGFYAVVLGIGMFFTSKKRWMAPAAVASVLLGLTCLYLSQIRALMVVTAVSIVAITGVLAMRRDYRRLRMFGVLLVAVLVVSFRGAVSLARGSVEQRLGSLTKASPQQVYEQNRGFFLQQAFEEMLPEYPLGAGVGRWGMMNSYFGSKDDPNPGLWAEIQWTGWILDGGAPLMLAYLVALFYLIWTTLGIARTRRRDDSSLSLWGTVILAYSIGALAFTFSYPVFLSQTGMEFWFLNAVLFAVARTQSWRDYWQRMAPA